MQKENLDVQKVVEIILLSTEKIWGITSVKKQVGKSYISQKIVNELNRIGKKVLYLGVGERDEQGKGHELVSLDKEIEMLKTRDSVTDNRVYISDSQNIDAIIYDDKFDVVLKEYENKYDFIIVDMKALEENVSSKKMCVLCQNNIVLLAKDVEDGLQTSKCVRELQDAGANVAGVILNEYSTKRKWLRM